MKEHTFKKGTVIVKWRTLGGQHYEGKLIEIDHCTGIVLLPDGTQKAMGLERLILDNGQVIIDNQTTFLKND